MQIPHIQGEFCQKEFFIYSAADKNYFDEFVPALANSIYYNTKHHLHLHLYNPRSDQLEYCTKRGISFTFEEVGVELFLPAGKKYRQNPANEKIADQKLRIETAMKKGGDQSIEERLQKTYFACARFICLKKNVKNHQKFLAIDVDAIVRSNLPMLDKKDFFIHHISGRKARFLAGGLFCTGQHLNFITNYGSILEEHVYNDEIYWGLDQDVLENLVPNYNWGQLPMEYIDWDMRPNSYIWTAKGKRKDLDIFKLERDKYLKII